MSSRLEKQDRDDVLHSLIILIMLAVSFLAYHKGAGDKQQEIEDRAKSTPMTVGENTRVEIILFGGKQGED